MGEAGGGDVEGDAQVVHFLEEESEAGAEGKVPVVDE